jgi:hypothetical protein
VRKENGNKNKQCTVQRIKNKTNTTMIFEHSKETVMKFAAQERYKETSEEKKE